MPVPELCWLLVPSPLLGPASWCPVSRELAARGHAAVVATTSMSSTVDTDHLGPWVDQVLCQLLAEGPDDGGDLVVVAHSGACPRTPWLVSQLLEAGWPVEAMILVDGRFPDGTAFTTDRPHYAALLDRLVRPDDYLPPWPRWWGSLVEGLVVEESTRRVVLDEAPPVPRGWFDQPCPVPDLPDSIGRAFLSFGAGYEDACQEAFDQGWQTMHLTGDHLHQVVAPAAVAATLLGLVARLAR